MTEPLSELPQESPEQAKRATEDMIHDRAVRKLTTGHDMVDLVAAVALGMNDISEDEQIEIIRSIASTGAIWKAGKGVNQLPPSPPYIPRDANEREELVAAARKSVEESFNS